MTWDQYWNGDTDMVEDFLEADRQVQKRKDAEAWQQGLYIYDAVSTAIHNAFSPKGSAPKQYPAQPYGCGSQKKKEELDDGMTKEEREVLLAKIALDNERRRRNGDM